MLSTNYRLRLEGICKDIASGTEVSIDDMIWAQKLAKANTSARGMLSQARRLSTDSDGSCLKYLDIGDPNTNKKGFNGADDIADWFKNDKSDDWRQRDCLNLILKNNLVKARILGMQRQRGGQRNKRIHLLDIYFLV